MKNVFHLIKYRQWPTYKHNSFREAVCKPFRAYEVDVHM